MGREVRMVPKDWKHPRDSRGRHIPMFSGDRLTACREYQRNTVLWACGAHPAQATSWGSSTEFYCDYARAPEEYGERGCNMFEEPRDDLTHYMLYETTSEGTPISPAFKTLDELCAWAEHNASTFANFHASAEEWKSMLSGGIVGHAEGNLFFC